MKNITFIFEKCLGLPLISEEIGENLYEILDKLQIKGIEVSFSDPDSNLLDEDLIDEGNSDDDFLDSPMIEESEAETDEVSDNNLSEIPEHDYEYTPFASSLIINMEMFEDIEINLPALEGIQLIFNPGEFPININFSDFNFKSAEITSVLSLKLSNEYLKPMNKITEADGSVRYEKGGTLEDIQVAQSTITIDGTGNFNVQGGIGLQLVGPVMIGDTGVILENIDMELNLSGDDVRPDGTPIKPQGTPIGWKGLFINSAELSIPDVFSSSISVSGLGIGSGGVSGSISLPSLVLSYDPDSQTPFTGDLVGEVFGMPGGLQEITLSLQQNIPSGGAIRAKMILPFFEKTNEPLDIDIGISADGSFNAAIHSSDGVLTLEKMGLLRLKIESIGFSIIKGLAITRLSGEVTPLFGDLTWPSFAVKELSIDSRGRVAINDGWIDLPKQLTMDFHGFGLEVSKIGFGKEDDGSHWIGCSGGFKLCKGLSLSAAVEGMRIYWKGSDVWLKVSGVDLAFEIPNSIAFEGRIEFIDDPNGAKGFRGSGKLKVIPTGLQINAELVVGRNVKDPFPSYTFFYIYLDAQLPAGIPLGQSGLAFYGLAGLFAYNMEPNKLPEQEWFDGWYKGDPVGVSSSQKWGDNRGSFALGAGITLGTATDNGYAVSAKSLLVLVLPGPILMIEGRATILQDRSKLSGDAPIKALTVLDARAGQIQMNLDVHYPPPSDNPKDMLVGMLLQVNAAAEAFFDFKNPNNWHLFVGQKDPHEKRVRALVYSIYEGNAYLMLYPAGFEMGAQVGYNANWKFGPLGITLQALIEGNLGVSWKPVQVKGGLGVTGQLALKAFGFKTGLSLSAWIEIEAPTPWRVFAAFDVKLDLPWPCPDLEAHIELEWQEAIPPPTPIPLASVGIEHLKVTEKWELNRYPIYDVNENGLWFNDSNEEDGPTQPEVESPVIPLDGKIILSFARPMIDAAKVGLNPSGIVAPERVGDYEFRYRLVSVKLERQSKTSAGGWETVAERSEGDPESDKEKLWGSWLAVTGESSSSGTSEIPSMTKLMLFAKSPFEYARETIDDTYFDGFSEWNPTYGMCVVNPPAKECFGFEDLLGKYGKGTVPGGEIRRGDVIIVGDNLRVDTGGVNGQESMLVIGESGTNTTLIFFPEYVRQLDLTVGRKTRTVVYYYDGTQKIGKWDVKNGLEDSMTFSFPKELTTNFNLLVIENVAHDTVDMELIRLCYITAREADRYLDEKGTAIHAADAGDAYEYPVETELHIPHSYYRIKVATEALRRRVGQSEFGVVECFEESSYFQTENPPGVDVPVTAESVSPSAGAEHYPVSGPLKDLGPYVERDKLIPKEGAQAVYRSYDIGIEFNEAYAEHMYMLSGRPLSIYLYDNNGQGIELAEQEIVAVGNNWQINDNQISRRADQEWEVTLAHTQQNVAAIINTAGGQDTAVEAGHSAAFSSIANVHLNSVQAPKQTGIWAGGEDMVLKPQTMYRAALVATEPKVVIPLTTAGEPILMNNSLQYTQVASDGSNFVSALEDSFGQVEVGVKIISDGKRAIVTDMRASETAQSVPIDRQMIDTVVKEALATVAPKPEPRSVFSWSFITSRFASFVHHVHSFIDTVWDLHATLGAAAWTDLTLPQRNELKGLIKASNPDLEQIYDKSIEFFDLEGRPLPERLEINVLEDANGRYGFMIESPEPIQWEVNEPGRVTLEVVKAADTVDPPMPAYGPAKFIDCVLSGNEYVEILVQADIDLSGHKIERVYDSTTPPDTYYEFAAESVHRAGTVIRIHSGEVPSNPSQNLECKDVYIGSTAEILSNRGETLRLIDPDGKEIHRRTFTSTTFNELANVLLAPDADGTRTFIYLLDNNLQWISQLGNGTYRFTFTFKRNAENGLPVLRRFGSTAQEEAVLEFNVSAE